MAQITSLNQLIDKFNDFADDHPMINDFGFGPTSDIGVSKQMQFPYFWTSFQSDSSIKVSNNIFTPELRFYFLVMDQLSNENADVTENGENTTNGQEILSDTFQIMQDFLNYLATGFRTQKLRVSEDIRIFPAEDETPDKVNGWVAEITIRVEHNSFTNPNWVCFSILD